MQQISLKDLLEAGCHFGHQVKRWHPRAGAFIYAARDGIHIIDLARTRDGLEKAAQFAKNLGLEGKILLFVATKRQAKGVVAEEARKTGIPYLTQRWIGGFITNWDEVKKNLEKVRQMRSDRDSKAWLEFPKHEQVKLAKTLSKLEAFYGGVAEVKELPDALFVVDIRKEDAAVREAAIRGITAIGIVDTNSDPARLDYPIPANDDAVGSIQYITRTIAEAYKEGKEEGVKRATEEQKTKPAAEKSQENDAKEPSSQKKTRKRTTSKKLKQN
ncbi:30S ribosomal protein S2 [Candidatus Gottesmanbacteria bacterium]|nr:30S ribosomal protein S2 [Candidatus Gottesmanbacteria bacterium]